MIKKLKVENFRSLRNIEITFEDDITVLIGENDGGKTSIVDALKIMFDNKTVEEDDFYYGTNKICITVETDDKTFIKEFEKNNGGITSRTGILFSKSELEEICDYLNSDEFNSLPTDDDKRNRLREYFDLFNIPSFRKNSRVDTLKQKVLDELKKSIDKIVDSEGRTIIEGNIPKYHVYFLDGKHFEDIQKFIKEIFFKEKIKNIWNEKCSKEKTIEDFILEKLNEYSKNIDTELKEGDVINKLKKYLPKLEDIKIEPIFEPKDIGGIDIKSILLENGREICVNKKGDGTKRRITMALLECIKSEQEKQPTLYVFDEPDTHLHVRAQRDLLRVISGFCENENQVIITTHSPFIMNSVDVEKIRLLSLENGETKITNISNKSVQSYKPILEELGIENISLFFSKILIVEGITEEVFIPKMYRKEYGNMIEQDLIKIIDAKGASKIEGFIEFLKGLVELKDIFILADKDIDDKPDLKKFMDNLEIEIPTKNIFKIGTYKEFEDAFEPEVIYEAWRQYVSKHGEDDIDKLCGEDWTVENISKCMEYCGENSKKFSDKLLKLYNKNSRGTKINKPKLAEALAEYCKVEHLPKELQDLLKRLRE